MGIVNNALSGASGQSSGYNLTKSLRFRRSASAYLNRTPASAGNRKTWTWSAWVKLGSLDVTRQIFGTGAGATHAALVFEAGNTLFAFSADAGQTFLRTSQVFRDPSAWYHVVWAEDTTQATASNRSKLYVNGVQITAFSTANYPSPDFQGGINNNVAQFISSYDGSTWLYDGYLAEVNFIDGQALTPSSFGETSTSTGVWIPKKYTGTYGTNGFYLPFTDTTSTSTLGTDFSGNSNTWTVNNISLTSGSTYDSMTDVPTLTSATTANYAVLNPINPPTGAVGLTYSNGNLNLATVNSGSPPTESSALSTIYFPSSGKFYAEMTVGTTLGTTSNAWPRFGVAGYGMGVGGYVNFGGSSYGTFTTSDVMMVAWDASNGKIWWGKNGTWLNSGNPAAGTGNISTFTYDSASAYVQLTLFYSTTGSTGSVNFGQRPFTYTPPTGFVALNTFNLPTPTIGATASTTANKYMDATTYTGNGSALTVTNSGAMQPDLLWTKARSSGAFHYLQDSVRGVNKALFSNSTDSEFTITSTTTTLNSNGFSFNGSESGLNANTSTYIGWQWRASNATAVTNTAGSITSTVSANTTAGFSIVTYTSPNSSSNQTVGHGLGVKPSMIIVKNRDSGFNWDIYHSSLGYNSSLIFTTAGTRSGAFGAEPTSTVFTTTNTYTHNGTDKYVAYCFAQVAGYSAFGSYTGNGSTDGVFVYTGFRPRYLMIKSTSVESWELFDTSRSPYNQAVALLEADSSGAENNSSTSAIDILSNGFKQRNTRGATNGSGTTYIYMAFAEVPYKFSNAR